LGYHRDDDVDEVVRGCILDMVDEGMSDADVAEVTFHVVNSQPLMNKRKQMVQCGNTVVAADGGCYVDGMENDAFGQNQFAEGNNFQGVKNDGVVAQAESPK
jgi:hypothetical protein